MKHARSLSASFLVFSLLLLSAITGAQAPWTQLLPPGAQPPVRQYGASTVLDAATDQLIMFGGNTGGPTNTVWVLSHATGTGPKGWTQLFPIGAAPAGVANHAAVYDPGTNRMIVFGGCNGACLPVNNRVYVLSNANGLAGTPVWEQLFPSGPAPASRQGFAAAYDQTTNQLIVFGGQDGSGSVGLGNTFDDTWLLRNANGLGGPPQWVQVSASGPRPAGRYAPSGAFDHVNDRLIITGGITTSSANTNGTWTLSGVTTGSGTWVNAIPPGTPGSPVPFAGIKGASHSGQGLVFLPIPNPGTTTHDIWVLQNATSWMRLSPTSGPGSLSSAMGSVYNPGNNVLLSFMTGAGGLVNQLWSIMPEAMPNVAPAFAAPTPFAPLTVVAGSPINITLVAEDPNPGNTVQINVDFGTLPSGVFVGPSAGTNPVQRTLSWTPSSNNVGTHTIQVWAQDNLFATTNHSVTITVLPPQLMSVGVNPASATIHNGGQPFNATARYSDGSSKFLTSAPGLMWSSSNPAVATIGSGGFAQAMAPGQAVIEASFDGVSCAATNECATLTVANGTPVAQINSGPAFVRNEATFSLFLNSGSSDPDFDQLTHQWSILSGPGAFSGPTNNFGVSFLHSDGPGVTTIELRVTDTYGASATTTATITTNNVAPTVSIFGNSPITIMEGSSINTSGNFQDPGTDTWTAAVNYGDGTGTQPLMLTGKNFQLSHRYAQYGVYTATVTVTDDDGGIGTMTKTVNVSNVMPSIQAGSTSDTVLAGQPFTRTGSFSDPGVSAWTATVNYGDGSGTQPLALAGQTFALHHVYSAGGTYPVSIAISDGVSTANAAISVTVVSVPAFSQLPDTPPGECVCTPATQIVTPNSPQDWFVKADASGSLTVTLVGLVSNEFAQTLQARILDLDGTILAQMMTSYPINSAEEAQFRESRTIAATPGALYRVQVASPTAHRARYFLRFDGARVAGVGSPTFSNTYGGSATWLLNVDGTDTASMRLFTQGIAEFQQPLARLIVYQWIAPNGVAEPMQSLAVTVPTGPQFLDTPLQPPSTVVPGIWRLRMSTDFDYRLEKQSGTDRGLYLDHRSGGRGSLKIHFVDENGLPFTDLVNMRVSIGSVKLADLPVEGGLFDLPVADGFVYHFDVTPPDGRIVSPASFDLTVVCDQLTEITVVIAPPVPPSLSVALSQSVLWPANNSMMTIAADIAAASPYGNAVAIELVSITDTEAGAAGDVAGAALGTDDRTFELRAEKSAGNTDRTYTVTYRVTDTGTGLSTTATATVAVPHSKKDKKDKPE